MAGSRDYLAMNRTFERFKTGEIPPCSVSTDQHSQESQQFIHLAQQHGYRVYSSHGTAPRVYIFGMTHTGNSIDQSKELESIMRNGACAGDMFMIEGRGPVEAMYEHYHRDDLVGRLKDHFSAEGIRTLFNDDDERITQFKIASSALTRAEESYDPGHPDLRAAVQTYLRAFRERDEGFCFNDATGIIPLVKGNSKNYRALDDTANIFQIIGLLHIFNGVIEESLRGEGVDYLVFIPNEV